MDSLERFARIGGGVSPPQGTSEDITRLQRREAVWLVVQAGDPVAGPALTPKIPMLNPKGQGGPR